MIINLIQRITQREVVNTVQQENSPAQLRHDTGSLLTPNLGRSNFPKVGKQRTVNILITCGTPQFYLSHKRPSKVDVSSESHQRLDIAYPR